MNSREVLKNECLDPNKEAKMNRFTRKHTLLVTGMLVALLTVSWQCSRKPSVPTAPEQAKESDARPADFVEFDKAPTIIRDVAPKYPELAKAAGIEGEIWLKIFVREDGGVDKVEVFKSTKPEIGFEEAAIAAAQKFEFKPALKNGRPVATWVVLPFKFKL
jgi:TonB family protein